MDTKYLPVLKPFMKNFSQYLFLEMAWFLYKIGILHRSFTCFQFWIKFIKKQIMNVNFIINKNVNLRVCLMSFCIFIIAMFTSKGFKYIWFFFISNTKVTGLNLDKDQSNFWFLFYKAYCVIEHCVSLISFFINEM